LLASALKRYGANTDRKEEKVMKVRKIRLSQGGFTPIELLIAMALIVLLMTIISQAFSAGVRAFDDLEAIGDLDEKLDDDCLALAERITATNQRASDFIQNSLRTGTVNADEANALRDQYQAICDTSLELEIRLREVQSRIEDPRAQRVLQRSLNELKRLKTSAATMVRWLSLF
jgi:prepilin-type N-terminal cleavage/methylation domain-containing protein